MAHIEIQHAVKPDEAGRIDLVVQALTKLSRADIRGIFEHGCVSLDGKPCLDSGAWVKEKSLVALRYDPHRRYKERPHFQSRIFRILHEDSSLMVVEKAAGVLTVPTVRREKENLEAAINLYLRRQSGSAYAAVVHRLDRDTSGLLVFGKSEGIAQRLKSQFEEHKPLREYLAIVTGTLEKPKGTFRSFLATDEDLYQRSVPSSKSGPPVARNPRTRDTRASHPKAAVPPGKLAITHYETVEVLKNATVVKVRLETGRRNQIRVHFAEIGHPVLGDSRYEPALARHPAWRYPRLALHAAKLGFVHPITGKSLAFDSAPGFEFEEFLRQNNRQIRE